MDICLFGASRDSVPAIYLEGAAELGRMIGSRGHSLVFGGGCTGVMGAAARGVREAGGRLIGIAPKFFDSPGVLVPDCDELIFTDTMAQRKAIMEERADSFLIAPGGIGTMDEFFQMLTLRSLGLHDRPLALYNLNGLYDDLLAWFERLTAESFISPEAMSCFGIFDDPALLLDYLEK